MILLALYMLGTLQEQRNQIFDFLSLRTHTKNIVKYLEQCIVPFYWVACTCYQLPLEAVTALTKRDVEQ